MGLHRILARFLNFRDIQRNGSLYLRRYYLLHPKLGLLRSKWLPHVFVHYIARSDWALDLHDHPWDWGAVLLTGSYVEVTPKVHRHYRRPLGPARVESAHQRRTIWPLIPRFRHANALHRLELHRPIWTLFWHGPRTRIWGFRTAGGWQRHEDYTRVNDPNTSSYEPQ